MFYNAQIREWTLLADNQGLGNGLAFSPDGSLWVGKAAWMGRRSGSDQDYIYTGTKSADIYNIKIASEGFELEFTQPLNKEETLNEDSYYFHQYNYDYHPEYGLDKKNSSVVEIKEITLSRNKKQGVFYIGENGFRFCLSIRYWEYS